MVNSKLGEVIRSQRETLGLSRKELAKQAQIPETTIVNIEMYSYHPLYLSIERFQRLADILQLSYCFPETDNDNFFQIIVRKIYSQYDTLALFAASNDFSYAFIKSLEDKAKCSATTGFPNAKSLWRLCNALHLDYAYLGFLTGNIVNEAYLITEKK